MNVQIVWIVLLSSLTTAAVTAGVLAWLWHRHLRPQLEARLLAAQDEFEQRVRAGVRAAGEELMPALRQQVAQGFRDGLRESAGGLVEDPARVVTRSAEVLEEGLRALFGMRPPRR